MEHVMWEGNNEGHMRPGTQLHDDRHVDNKGVGKGPAMFSRLPGEGVR